MGWGKRSKKKKSIKRLKKRGEHSWAVSQSLQVAESILVASRKRRGLQTLCVLRVTAQGEAVVHVLFRAAAQVLPSCHEMKYQQEPCPKSSWHGMDRLERTAGH